MCMFVGVRGQLQESTSVAIYLDFETRSLIGLELSKHSRLAGQCALGASCLHLPKTDSTETFLHGLWDQT